MLTAFVSLSNANSSVHAASGWFMFDPLRSVVLIGLFYAIKLNSYVTLKSNQDRAPRRFPWIKVWMNALWEIFSLSLLRHSTVWHAGVITKNVRIELKGNDPLSPSVAIKFRVPPCFLMGQMILCPFTIRKYLLLFFSASVVFTSFLPFHSS